ncbi:glycosyltransferase [uncultured Shewanella sp.]|uniref:glycosyltransferase family 2 protein n=1 Tax=uncultured Shewanella sp. TaxID=173975 RepID=UPI0026356670|nr:glycosyltransferase [uncultured Shewanella sp.]
MTSLLSSSFIIILFLLFILSLIISTSFESFYLDITTFVFIFSINLTYWMWRTTETLPELSLLFAWAWIFYLFETLMILNSVFTSFLISMNNIKKDKNYALNVKECPPSIDIFITTYNEPENILEKTIVCTQNIHYSNFNIWVLDDGNRPSIQTLCTRYKVNYIGREDRSHFKAGNLNNALNHSSSRTNADFILVLDADFLCHRDILTTLLNCIDKENIALVQAAQYFYNNDPMQHNFLASQAIVDDQRIFFEAILPGLDKLDTALCCGCPSLIQRKALAEVGGFPTNTVTEDISLTYALFEKKYIVRYTKEIVAYGMSPETLKEYIKQRSRWCIGTLQQFFSKNSCFAFNKQNLLQRIEFLSCVIHWLSYPFRIMCLIAPILTLLFSITTLKLINEQNYLIYIPVIIISNVMYLSLKHKGKMLVLLSDAINFVISMPLVWSIIQSLSRRGKTTFSVTNKDIKVKDSIVNYHVALPSIFIIILYLLSMLNSHFYNYQLSFGDYTHFALIWISINTILLIVGIFMTVDLPRIYHKWSIISPEITIKLKNGQSQQGKIDGISINECDLFIEKKTLNKNDPIELDLLEYGYVQGLVENITQVPLNKKETQDPIKAYKITVKLLGSQHYLLRTVLGYVFSAGRISLMTHNDYRHLLKRLLKRLSI